jgi:hypothetical protein
LFGLAFVVFGAVLLFTDVAVLGGVFLGLGVVFTMRGMGLARAGRKFKALAAEDADAGNQS